MKNIISTIEAVPSANDIKWLQEDVTMVTIRLNNIIVIKLLQNVTMRSTLSRFEQCCNCFNFDI